VSAWPNPHPTTRNVPALPLTALTRRTLRYMLDHILERKSYQDLWSSIKSGRFETQKYRLVRCGCTSPAYLLEGSPEQLPEGASPVQLH
jgi:ERCC4-type nuclease